MKAGASPRRAISTGASGSRSSRAPTLTSPWLMPLVAWYLTGWMSWGLADNTLVIWTADHGDGLASHGGRFDKGSYLTEEVLRVPLAMRYPDQIPAGQASDALACGTDIAPTILDAAGLRFERPGRWRERAANQRQAPARTIDLPCWLRHMDTASGLLNWAEPSSRIDTS